MQHSRALALDALRGLAIVGMVLSGSVTFNGALAAWMYHAQVPPPAYRFNPSLPGITWVDLVFPFFLFALGAAIPLAYTHRTMPSTWREYTLTAWSILKRGLLLAGFAMFIQHIRQYALAPQTSTSATIRAALVGLLGYALLFLALGASKLLPTSLQQRWSLGRQTQGQMERLVQLTGVALCVVLVLALDYSRTSSVNAFGYTFNPNRSDIIILVLSNVAVAGTALWLVTKQNPLLRLGLLGFLLGLRLTQTASDSWNVWLWNATPAAWLFKVYYLQYLFIVLPGTFAGEMIVECLQRVTALQESSAKPSSTRSFNVLLGTVAFAFIPLNLWGLFSRALWANVWANVALVVLGYWLFRLVHDATPLQRLHRRLYNWGVYWLLLGLCFEAFEGGIKKDKSTLSYYALTSGLAFLSLIWCSLVVDWLERKRTEHTAALPQRLVRPLVNLVVNTGQNPMIAYVTGGMLLLPLMNVVGLQEWYDTAFSAQGIAGAWLGFLRGVLFTLLVMLVSSWCTKRGIFWRA